MKTITQKALALVTGTLLVVSASAAERKDSGFYVKVDLGGSVVEDIDLDEYFGLDVSGSKVELSPGFRGGITAGYDVTPWFAPEVQVGWMINEIDNITGAVVLDDATLSNIPFFVNAKFQYPIPRSIVTPYAGAGVGFTTSIFDIDFLAISDGFQTVSIEGTDADTVFAWQAFAGVRFALNPQMGLSVEYHYMQAESPTWEADFVFGGGNNDFSLGRSATHTVSLAFDFRF